MKSVAGPLVAAIVLAVAGFGFWLLGKTETRIADWSLTRVHIVANGVALDQFRPADSPSAERRWGC